MAPTRTPPTTPPPARPAAKPQAQTPAEGFLQPLAALAARMPAIEALIFWGSEAGWSALPDEALESEEITFWAEGLIPEGFRLEWRIIAEADGTVPDHIRIYAWEQGEPPPALPPETGTVLAMERWPG